MRRLSPLTLVALLLLQTLAVGIAAPVSATSARGGPSDDWSVESITIGNASVGPKQWVQSDGTVVDYLLQGDTIEVTVVIKRGGSDVIAESSDAMLQVVHPIGFVMETFNWNTGDLFGSGQRAQTFLWTADVAHTLRQETQT